MNTTTFTIESVHGVKQTFILGLPARPTTDEVARRHASGLDQNAVAKDSADAKQCATLILSHLPMVR